MDILLVVVFGGLLIKPAIVNLLVDILEQWYE